MEKIEDFWKPISKSVDLESGEEDIAGEVPDDGEEVLITVDGNVTTDTFGINGDGSFYFEDNFIEDVTAWMPKPKPYK